MTFADDVNGMTLIDVYRKQFKPVYINGKPVYQWEDVKKAINLLYQTLVNNSVDDIVGTVYNDQIPMAINAAFITLYINRIPHEHPLADAILVAYYQCIRDGYVGVME